MYQLFIENREVDIDEKIGIQLSYAIDDISQFATRNTSFSKQIVLKGTNRTNNALGLIFELGNANPFAVGQRNIGKNFNVAQTARAELRLYGLMILKGVFRLIGIQKNRDIVEYEGVLFGELAGFISKVSNKKLEDLDFSEYDHTYNETNIVNSWDAAQGSGYFYPLIDYGTYSTNKVDYDIRTFRPAFYVKEYLDKIFEAAGYTYECDFFDTARFKSLIIPHNTKILETESGQLLFVTLTNKTISRFPSIVRWSTFTGGSFTNTSLERFTYNSATTVSTKIRLELSAVTDSVDDVIVTIRLVKNGTDIYREDYVLNSTSDLFALVQLDDLMAQNDYYEVYTDSTANIGTTTTFVDGSLTITTDPPQIVPIDVTDTVLANMAVPKGIFQSDFFASILKMFNLYVNEDKLDENKLVIKPYIDFYTGENVDWTYQVARDKTWNIMPMGNLNGRIFEYKHKDDNDFYNEGYRKKYNISYGSRQFDTGFQFSKDRQTTDVIFAGSPLVQYTGTDKVVAAIYKKSKGNSVDQEELTDSIIRILTCKKVTGVASWKIKNGATDLVTLTSYGYAGHLNDPVTPDFDLNFGAPNEIYCSPTQYTSNNLFNLYWSSYIAEIADKDSKLLKCHVYLRPIDIAKLDFSKDVFIDGIRFRINKIEDYDGLNNELTKVELLKVING